MYEEIKTKILVIGMQISYTLAINKYPFKVPYLNAEILTTDVQPESVLSPYFLKNTHSISALTTVI